MLCNSESLDYLYSLNPEHLRQLERSQGILNMLNKYQYLLSQQFAHYADRQITLPQLTNGYLFVMSRTCIVVGMSNILDSYDAKYKHLAHIELFHNFVYEVELMWDNIEQR